MHSLLENYLAEIALLLAPLPIARREEELQELRQHLMNVIIVNQETGLSEDEAVRYAIGQFGTPQMLGESVVQAWQRGDKKENQRSFWGAVICVTVLSYLGTILFSKIVQMTSLFQSPFYSSPNQSWKIGLTLFLSAILVMALAGGISGLIFPKRAVKGTVCAVVVMYVISIGPSLVRTALTAGGLHGLLLAIYIFVGSIAIFGGPAVVFAWLISRWRGNYPARLVRS